MNGFNHIYENLDSDFTSLSDAGDDWADTSTLLKFDQSEFIDYGWGSSGLRTRGWLFFPDSCATQ